MRILALLVATTVALLPAAASAESFGLTIINKSDVTLQVPRDCHLNALMNEGRRYTVVPQMNTYARCAGGVLQFNTWNSGHWTPLCTISDSQPRTVLKQQSSTWECYLSSPRSRAYVLIVNYAAGTQ